MLYPSPLQQGSGLLAPVPTPRLTTVAGTSGQRLGTALGTAQWHTGTSTALAPMRDGLFWLGHDDRGQALGLADARHVLLCAGTRGGKGVSVIVPNLALWPGPVVCIDPKGENALVTARRRGLGSPYCWGMGQKVHILDPFGVVERAGDDFADLKACFNPLDAIDTTRDEAVDEAARVADALVVADGSKDPYWEESARSLIKAVILHVASSAQYAQRRSLLTVRALLMEGDGEARRIALASAANPSKVPSGLYFLFAAMKRNTACGGVIRQAGEMFGMLEQGSARTLAIISQIACQNTEFIESPGMARVLARSSFALSDLKTSRKGVSLYLSLPQRFMNTHARWLRMMSALILTEMERVRQQPACGHPVLMVLDEFAGLKRMRSVENAVAQLAGFGVKLVLVVQTLAQLKDVYGDNWETLVANAGARLFFCNDDQFTRDYASKLAGECEVTRTTTSQSTATSRTITESTGSSSGFNTGYSNGGSGGPQGATFSYSSSGGSSFNYSSGLSVAGGMTQTQGTAQGIHKRFLVTPDEVGRLFGMTDRPKMLVLLSGHQPVALTRARYHAWDYLSGRYDAHPDHPAPLTLPKVLALREQRRMERERQQREDMARAQKRKKDNEEWMRKRQAMWDQSQRETAERQRQRARRRRVFWTGLAAFCAVLLVGAYFWFSMQAAKDEARRNAIRELRRQEAIQQQAKPIQPPKPPIPPAPPKPVAR